MALEEASPRPEVPLRPEVPVEELAPTLFDITPDATLVAQSLADRFVIPPFTVLDTRQGYWKDRRQLWLSLGIQSEVGRDENLLNFSDTVRRGFGSLNSSDLARKAGRGPGGGELPIDDHPVETQPVGSGTSVFDPVLCEIAYRWWCPPGGMVFDPFAGGSVRGVIASALGRRYVGIELRPEQVAANRVQGDDILSKASGEPPMPIWVEGDCTDPSIILPRADMIFTCPPYADLEVYSDDPRDLSTMDADAFDDAYRKAMALTVGRLNEDRFAVIAIGNVRDRKGRLRDLLGLTISAMEEAGAAYYNDAILLNSVGTASMRANRIFSAMRKLVRVHQCVLVFLKGDAQKAADALEGRERLFGDESSGEDAGDREVLGGASAASGSSSPGTDYEEVESLPLGG